MVTFFSKHLVAQIVYYDRDFNPHQHRKPFLSIKGRLTTLFSIENVDDDDDDGDSEDGDDEGDDDSEDDNVDDNVNVDKASQNIIKLTPNVFFSKRLF